MRSAKNLEPAALVAIGLGIRPATLLAWHRRGLIPGYRAGLRPVLFDRDEVKAALAARAESRRIEVSR